MNAVSLVVPAQATESQVVGLLKRLQKERLAGRLSDLIPPTTPGHIFRAVYDPGTRQATFTSLDADLGDIPINTIAFDDRRGDLYAATDFGPLILRAGSSNWQIAGIGFPEALMVDLKMVADQRILVAAPRPTADLRQRDQREAARLLVGDALLDLDQRRADAPVDGVAVAVAERSQRQDRALLQRIGRLARLLERREQRLGHGALEAEVAPGFVRRRARREQTPQRGRRVGAHQRSEAPRARLQGDRRVLRPEPTWAARRCDPSRASARRRPSTSC